MEINFDGVVSVLKQSEKLVRSTRKLLGDVGVVFPHMGELEANLRARRLEVAEYAKLVKNTDKHVS